MGAVEDKLPCDCVVGTGLGTITGVAGADIEDVLVEEAEVTTGMLAAEETGIDDFRDADVVPFMGCSRGLRCFFFFFMRNGGSDCSSPVVDAAVPTNAGEAVTCILSVGFTVKSLFVIAVSDERGEGDAFSGCLCKVFGDEVACFFTQTVSEVEVAASI